MKRKQGTSLPSERFASAVEAHVVTVQVGLQKDVGSEFSIHAFARVVAAVSMFPMVLIWKKSLKSLFKVFLKTLAKHTWTILQMIRANIRITKSAVRACPGLVQNVEDGRPNSENGMSRAELYCL